MMEQFDVSIVGAGIGGLALAYRLTKAGLSVLVIEEKASHGGPITSKHKDGFLLELGPNTLLCKEEVYNLIQDLGLDEKLEKAQPTSRKRFLAVRGFNSSDGLSIQQTPTGLISALTTPLISRMGILRALKEPFIAKSTEEDLSVHEFITRRLGKEVADNLVAPMLSGIWAADITKLSARSALPTLWNLEKEFGSILKGFLRRKTKASKSPRRGKRRSRSPMISLDGGLSILTERLAQEIGPSKIRLNTKLERMDLGVDGAVLSLVTTDDSNQVVSQVAVRKVVLTQSADMQSGLIAPYDLKLSERINSIPYSPLGALYISFDKNSVSHPLDGFGFLVPPKFGVPLLGGIFSSQLFAHRAPPDKYLVTAFVGGACFPDQADIRDEGLTSFVLEHLRSLLQAKHTGTVVDRMFYPKAIPNYPQGHYKTVEALRDFEIKHTAVKFFANWREGISVPDRIRLANILAIEIVMELS